jgi:urease gamma subunit
MDIIRQHFLTKIFTLVTGLIFLNMSFFLAEVCLLKYNQTELVEIAKLILNTGFEEERDGEATGADTMAKGVDLLMHQSRMFNASSFLMSVNLNKTLVDHYRHADHSLIFFPPPDHI